MDHVEHHHAGLDFGLVVDEFSLLSIATPDSKRCGRHYLFSSMTCFNSSGSGFTGTCSTRGVPSALLVMIRLHPPHVSLFSGKSSRKWAPRLSWRISAARATTSDTVSRCRKSNDVCQPLLYSRLPMTPAFAARAFRPWMTST